MFQYELAFLLKQIINVCLPQKSKLIQNFIDI